MSTHAVGSHGAQTVQRAQETGAELQRSARYAGRTLRSAGETVRAAFWDGAYALLGLGDVATAVARDSQKAVRALPQQCLALMRSTPARLNDTLEELTLRGQHLATRIRRDRDVRTAVRRTAAAGREAREAVDSLRNAARAQARGARKAGRRLGSAARQRYQMMTVDELQELAGQRDIEGRSSMNKRELVRALAR